MDFPVDLVHRDTERGSAVGDAEHVGEFLHDILDRSTAMPVRPERFDGLHDFLAEQPLAKFGSSPVDPVSLGVEPRGPVALVDGDADF